jgi:D-alanyl-D-alanine carboxypeptidase
MRLKLAIVIIAVIALCAGLYWYVHSNYFKNRVAKSSSSGSSAQSGFNKTQFSLTDPNSIWIIVNKNHPLPASYIPGDLVDVNVPKRPDKTAEELRLKKEAATHMQDLVNGAKAEGINLVLGSGYRSYAQQQYYHDNYAATSGTAEADKFSAMPGKSEHQTGLAADLSTASGNCYLDLCFANTEEGKWLAANAYKYGFIIRYQQGKEAIDGYQYEPWHVRYVGIDLANQVHDTGQTLEEFFSIN